MSRLNKSNILVTGGAGQTGSHIVKELLKKEVKKVIVYDNMSTGSMENLNDVLDDERLVVVKRDLIDTMTLDYSVYDSDYIFHCASANEKMCNESPETGLVTNVIGTFNLLRCADKYNVKKVVSLSIIPYWQDEEFGDINNFYDFTHNSVNSMSSAFFNQFNLDSTTLWKLPNSSENDAIQAIKQMEKE